MKRFVPFILLSVFGINCQKNMNTEVPAGLLPALTTAPISLIVYTNATSGGTITDDGGTPITARGICWGTAPGPTVSGNHTVDSSGKGTFVSVLSGLTQTATYYVRAYATNSSGTAYGNEISFNHTPSPLVPTVTTTAVSLLFSTTASSGGNVTSDNGAGVSSKGVCWSTSPNPTKANAHTLQFIPGTGLYTSAVTGLLPLTKYYLKAYATNYVGTGYGNEISFTTPAPDVFVAGSTYANSKFIATLWTNGVPLQLGTGATNSIARSVFVSGNDVYVAGYEQNSNLVDVPKLWKNGVGSELLPVYAAANTSSASSVFVSDTNVYVTGNRSPLSSIARFWKNGVGTDISSALGGFANCVFASGNDVYIAGRLSAGFGLNEVATLWKNGVPTTLQGAAGTSSNANAVFVSGTDVYVTGTVPGGARLWKNGVMNNFNSSSNIIAPWSLFVSGPDVYVAGYEAIGSKNVARSWKNGVGTTLINSTYQTYAFSVYVLAGDVYVTGVEVGNINIAKLWKNGVEINLSDGTSHATGYSVFVR